MKGDLAELGVALDVTLQDEHVGEVEQYIHTIKEQIGAFIIPFHSNKCLHD